MPEPVEFIDVDEMEASNARIDRHLDAMRHRTNAWMTYMFLVALSALASTAWLAWTGRGC